MACIALPIPQIPTPPFEFSFTPPVPQIPSLNINLCCKLPPVDLPIPPIPVPTLLLSSGLLETLKEAIAQVNSYLNTLPLECPLE